MVFVLLVIKVESRSEILKACASTYNQTDYPFLQVLKQELNKVFRIRLDRIGCQL